jgi:5-methylcytosine-specific restriction protein B
MLDWIRKIFHKTETEPTAIKRSQSDEVRKFVKQHFVIPARAARQDRVTLTAGEVAKGLKLQDRMPMICNALDAKKFEEFARVKVIRREGPRQGSTAKWTLKILP